MEWARYVSEELLKSSKIDGMQIVFDNEHPSVLVPPIIRISIELLNRFMSFGEKRLVMVFPEGNLSPFLLMILKIVSDILEGRIKSTYNPYSFKKGQKLKCKNCVVEFDRIDSSNGSIMLYVRDAECIVGVPIESSPMFQLTDTNRKLSKDIEFSKIKKVIREQKSTNTREQEAFSILLDNKTHYDNTVFVVSPIGKSLGNFNNISINGKNVNELLLVGHADIEGFIEVVGKGQLSGNPAIVLASDLYAVCEAIKKAIDVKMLLIDISNTSILNGQLDALDELKALGFLIVCVTDTANSFDLSTLEDRDFFVWRWDEESILESLLTGGTDPIEKKIKICATQNIQYIECISHEIDEVASQLYLMRKLIAESTFNIIRIYEKMFSIVLQYIRRLIPISEKEENDNGVILKWCEEKLEEEERFCDPKLLIIIKTCIGILLKINMTSSILAKIGMLKVILNEDDLKKCCIIPVGSSKEKYQAYWNEYCKQDHINENILFVTPDEYINELDLKSETTIVCGWLGKDKMRQIVFSYKTQQVIVLLYGYEKRWQNSHIKSWNKILHNGSKIKVLEKLLIHQDIEKDVFLDPEFLSSPDDSFEDLDEINLILRENQYKRYLINGETSHLEETVEAIPVNYIGGYFSFYKTSHKLVSVGDIILKNKNEIQMIYPSELRIGDFIVVRESDKDLIKEMADNILAASGLVDTRKNALKWRESLEVESIFTNFDDIFNKLKIEGCKKNKYTIKQWIKNEDIITPQDKDDLIFIARATGDDVLLKNLDEVYVAGKLVKSAHIQAGRNLSILLKSQISIQLKELGEIDPYNIWEPIQMNIEGIGNCKLLKVIDIGRKVTVESSNINRLIQEF